MTSNCPKTVPALVEIIISLKRKNRYNASMVKPPIRPNSSKTMEKERKRK